MRWRASGPQVLATCIGLLLPLVTKAGDDASSEPVVAPKPARSSVAVLLKYRFEPNQTLHYHVTHKMSTLTQKGHASQSTKSEWTTLKHMRVISIDAQSIATVETVIDRVQATVQIDNEPQHRYDSASDTAPPAPLRGVSEIIGKPLAHTRLATDGRLISSTSLQNAAAGPLANADDGSDDPSRKNFLVELPATPVRVGESWKDTFIVKVAVPPKLQRSITLGRKYTLTSLENGIATIQLQTTVLTPVNNPEIEAQLIQRPQQGEFQFDVAKGLIVSRTLRVDEVVAGFNGPNSMMKAKSSLIESLTPPDALASQAGGKTDPVATAR